MTGTAYVLAPMEGLTDPPMRDVLTRISRYDWCVTEFLRITDMPQPDKVLFAHCPELSHGSCTPSGVPVHVQLLGSNPEPMAETAASLARLGAAGIDINFGCPAKTVNRHRGGAALLGEAELMHDIVASVRSAVPPHVPVSAKIRLGIDDATPLLVNAEAVRSAGASWLTIHARTRAQGYRPPVDWQAIAEVTNRFPGWRVIANGDIDSRRALDACREITGCTAFMLGRGAVSRPDLVNQLRHPGQPATAWATVCDWQRRFLSGMTGHDQGVVGRYKQWLAMTVATYPGAAALFEQVKRLRRRDEVLAAIDSHLAGQGVP